MQLRSLHMQLKIKILFPATSASSVLFSSVKLVTIQRTVSSRVLSDKKGSKQFNLTVNATWRRKCQEINSF